MATIINTPGTGNSGNDSGAAAGWTVAVVAIILLALVGLFVWNAERAPGDGAAAGEGAPQAAQGSYNAGQEPPVVNNFTTINATTSINNSTTTRD